MSVVCTRNTSSLLLSPGITKKPASIAIRKSQRARRIGVIIVFALSNKADDPAYKLGYEVCKDMHCSAFVEPGKYFVI
jgi:hypothetical protein